MCTLSHGRNQNKMHGDGVKQKEQEQRLSLDGKLDNIFEIDGYRIRKYVNDEGEAVVIIVKKIGTERVYDSERKVTVDREFPSLYIPNLR